MWHISFMGNKKNQEFKNDVLPKNSKKMTNNPVVIARGNINKVITYGYFSVE